MKLIKLYILCAFFSCIVLGCTKSNFIIMFYDETSCSDKWDYNSANEILKDNVVAYLKKQGIKVLEIEIFGDGTIQTCKTCDCKTGRRVKCKVRKREEDNMKSEGFY